MAAGFRGPFPGRSRQLQDDVAGASLGRIRARPRKAAAYALAPPPGGRRGDKNSRRLRELCARAVEGMKGAGVWPGSFRTRPGD